MKGVEFAEVRDAIASAFGADDFDMFLAEKLNFDRALEVADGPHKKVVNDVLRKFEQEGRDPYLIAEVAAVRPKRDDVQQVYQQYARGLIGGAYGVKVEVEKLKALERYGLIPKVDLQTAGIAQIAAVPVTQEGFQKRIRLALHDVDPWVFANKQLQQMRRVCRVEVDGAAIGTGFLVGPDVVMTNLHVVREVIDAKGQGDRIACRFDFHIGDGGGVGEGIPVPLTNKFADWHLDSTPPLSDAEENAGKPSPTSNQLDHAVVRLAKAIGSESIFAGYPDGPKRGWVRVPDGPPALAAGMPLAILHHPQGAPVKLALDTQAVLSVNDNRTRVRYTTNTDQGSSGSPCFDQDWGLVALHHFGDPLHHQAEFNQGVPIAAIRARLVAIKAAGCLAGDPP